MCLQPEQTCGRSVYGGGINTVLPLLQWFLRHHVVLPWDFSPLKWCYCLIPCLSLDWNVSINICVLFFSIHPSPSHEKHTGVSWLTTAAERVGFQHHLFFVGLFCFLFSTSLFSYNTNCTASDLKWNSRCPTEKGIIGSEKYLYLNCIGFLETIIGWFYEMHANLLCRPYCPNSQVFLQELMRAPWSSSPTFKMSFNSLCYLAENVLI